MMQTSVAHVTSPPRTEVQILTDLHNHISADIQRLNSIAAEYKNMSLSPGQHRGEPQRVIELKRLVDSCVEEMVQNQNTAALREQRARTIMRELRGVDTTVREFADFLRGHTGELRSTRDLLQLNVSPIPACPDVVELLSQAKSTLRLPDSGFIDPNNNSLDAFALLTRFMSFAERTGPLRATLSELHEKAVTFSKDARERLRPYDELRSKAKELRERLQTAESKGGQAADRFRDKLDKIEAQQLRLPAEKTARSALEREMNAIIGRFSETYRQVADAMTLGSFDPQNSIRLVIETRGLSPIGARVGITCDLLMRELLAIDSSCSPSDFAQTRLEHLHSLIYRMQRGDVSATWAMEELGEFRNTLLLVGFIITLTSPSDIPLREFVPKVKANWLSLSRGNEFAAITPVLATCFDKVTNHVRKRQLEHSTSTYSGSPLAPED